MPEKSLEISGLAYAYPDGNQALYGVNLSINQGERVALLGPNGAGKTTLVLHLNGIIPTMQGQVRVAGELVDSKSAESIKSIRHKLESFFKILMINYLCQPLVKMSPLAPITQGYADRARKGG